MLWPWARRFLSFRDPVESQFEWLKVGKLATDMHVDADNLDIFQGSPWA